MNPRFLLNSLSLSLIFSSVGFLILERERFKSFHEIDFNSIEIKLFLFVLLYLLLWNFSVRFKSFMKSRINIAFRLMRFVLSNVDRILIGLTSYVGPIIAIIIFIGLIVKLSDQNQLPRTPSNINQKMLQDFNLDRKNAVERNLIRRILKLRSRPEDQAMLMLAGVDKTTNIPNIPEYNFKLRQKFVLELLKLEQAAGYKIDFHGAYLNEMDFSRRLLKAHNLEGVLEGADFSSAYLQGAKFRDTNLQGANFSNARLIRTHLIGSNLIDANFDTANLQGAIFSGARLKGTRLHRVFLLQTFFKGSYLNGALADSPNWIQNYHQLNSFSYAFSIKWHSIVEQKDKQGNSIYVFHGEDPPLIARKP